MSGRDFIAVDAAFVAAHIDRLKTAYPELAEDADLLAAAVEGETDFNAVMEKIVERFLDAVTVKEAIAQRIANLEARGARYDKAADAMRSLAFGIMRAAEQRSVRLPEATISIANGRRRLVIDDLEAIPQGYVRTERVPLKVDIGTALNAGEDIPGAHLEPAEQHLSIRTK